LIQVRAVNNQLAALPESFGSLINLEDVDLSGNNLASLPHSLQKLVKISKLNMAGNNLTVLPASISALTRLTDLSFAKNSILEIEGDALAGLTNLSSIDLQQNELVTFDSVPKSQKLDQILLAFNRIEKLGNLERSPNISVLDLHNNKLTKLPDTVTQLFRMKTLKVSNNDLGDINPRIALIDSLVRISIEGNPLKRLKPAMRTAGAKVLKEFLAM